MAKTFDDILAANTFADIDSGFAVDTQPKSQIRNFDDIPAIGKIGFIEAAKEDIPGKIPFSPTSAIELYGVVSATKRLQRDDYKTSFFLPEQEGLLPSDIGYVPPERRQALINKQRQFDIDLITKYLEEQEERNRRGYTTLGRVGQITSEMPAFMIEFYYTGGLQKLGSKSAQKAATKMLRNYASTTAGKAMIATSGAAVGTGLRAAGMPNRMAESILRRQVPTDIQINEDGSVKIEGPVESDFTSIWKGLTDHYIEIASEQAGEYIAPVISSGFNKLPFIGKLTNQLQKRWLQLNPGKKVSDFTKKIGTTTGFHGVLTEVGEEYLGDMTRAIVNVDDFGAGEDAGLLQRISAAAQADTQALPAMLISFSIPGVATGVANIAVTRQQNADKERQKALDIITGTEINVPTQISTAEGDLGYEDDFFLEKWEQAQPKYKFDTPGTGKYFTPKWLLNRMLGVETLLEDVDKAAMASNLEQQHLNSWVNQITKKLKKEKDLTRLPDILPKEIEKEVYEKTKIEESDLEEIITAEGAIGEWGGYEIEVPKAEKTKAHILQTKLDSNKPIHIMRDLLDTYERAPSFLNESETKIFNQVRELTRYLRKRANLVREKMGLKPIGEIKAYITHWMDVAANRVVNRDVPIHSGYLYYLMKGLPKEVKNVTATRRKIRDQMEDYFSKDLGRLLRIMTSYDLRDIHLAQPYQAIWDELQGLREKRLIPDSTYKEVEDYLLYDIRKFQTLSDRMFNRTVKKPVDLLNKLLPAKKIITDASQSTFNMLRRIGFLSGLGFRLRPPGRNLGQRLLLGDLYRTQDLAKAQAVAFRLAKMPVINHPITGEKVKLIDLIREQDWYQAALRKFEDTVNAVSRVERSALYIYSKTHIGNLFLSNVEISALTGYFDWENSHRLSQDVKTPHYKNAIKHAKKLGIPVQELLTQEEDMLWNIREAVRRTQWEYFSISMPSFYRGEFKKALGQFQSWWMNYFFNHSREMINQSLTGRNSLGRLLTPYGRLRAMKGMGTIQAIARTAESLFGIEMLKYLFVPWPGYLPPIPALVAGILQYFTADTDKEKRKALRNVKHGLKFWIPFSAFGRDLNKLLSGEYSISDFIFYKKPEKK